jgi:hypothetical protein
LTKLDASSLRGHVTCPEHREHSRIWTTSARGHFEFTSKLLGSRQLDSRPLRSLFETTWLDKTRLEATSRPLGSLGLLGSAWLCLARFGFAQFCSAGVGSAGLGLSRPRWLDSARLGSTLFEEAIQRNCSRKLSRRH